MHYYSFHINDYRAATAHLSNEEDLAYRRLIDMYYDTENKIPLDTHWVSRRIRVGIKVVEAVLIDMFIRTEDGWMLPRCQEEIEHYHQNAQKNRENGRRGGRPKKTQSVSSGIPMATQSKPKQKATINHEIRTINKELKETHITESVLPVSENLAICEIDTSPKVTDIETVKRTRHVKREGVKLHRFEEFWEVYDKKVSRGNAEYEWRKVQHDDELIDRIIGKAKLYVNTTPDKQFRKHPTTWLHNKCWDDEIIDRGNGNGMGQMTQAERARRAVGISIFGNLEEQHGRQGEVIDITPAPPAGYLGSEDI